MMLYVLLAHPSAYAEIWRRRNWYVIILGIPVVPLLLIWSVQVLVWRVYIDSVYVEIRSLSGRTRRPIGDVATVERMLGRLKVLFRDGRSQVIPSIVGDLDRLHQDLVSKA